MSEYVTPTYLLANGRFTELLAGLPLEDSVTATLDTPDGEYEIAAGRVGVTVIMLATGRTMTVRAMPSEAHAQMFMDTFRSMCAGDDADATTEIPSDFMVV